MYISDLQYGVRNPFLSTVFLPSRTTISPEFAKVSQNVLPDYVK